jgi:hypothetical protein
MMIPVSWPGSQIWNVNLDFHCLFYFFFTLIFLFHHSTLDLLKIQLIYFYFSLYEDSTVSRLISQVYHTNSNCLWAFTSYYMILFLYQIWSLFFYFFILFFKLILFFKILSFNIKLLRIELHYFFYIWWFLSHDSSQRYEMSTRIDIDAFIVVIFYHIIKLSILLNPIKSMTRVVKFVLIHQNIVVMLEYYFIKLQKNIDLAHGRAWTTYLVKAKRWFGIICSFYFLLFLKYFLKSKHKARLFFIFLIEKIE